MKQRPSLGSQKRSADHYAVQSPYRGRNEAKQNKSQTKKQQNRQNPATPIKGFFFPSCASVALARSSHIVVLMNELCRCNCYVPHWGVESGVRTITQSKVKPGSKNRKSQEATKQNKTKTHQSKQNQPNNKTKKESPDQTTPMGWQMMPLNYEILHRNKHKTPDQKARSCEGVQQNNPLSSAETQDPPLPGSRRSRREALQA